MNKTDILTGRIIQRIFDTRMKSKNISIIYGVDDTHDINYLVSNLFEFFPDCMIQIKRLNHGYELKIEINKDGIA